MAYTIEFSNRAFRKFQSLPRDMQEKLKPYISNLADDPRPDGTTNMKELSKTYRLRVGDYRIVYSVFDDKLVVLVLSTTDRQEVYSSKEISALSRTLKQWLSDHR